MTSHSTNIDEKTKIEFIKLLGRYIAGTNTEDETYELFNKLISSHSLELLERLKQEWFWFNYAKPNLDTDDHKAIPLSVIDAEINLIKKSK